MKLSNCGQTDERLPAPLKLDACVAVRNGASRLVEPLSAQLACVRKLLLMHRNSESAAAAAVDSVGFEDTEMTTLGMDDEDITPSQKARQPGSYTHTHACKRAHT
jgi:hypothetical protein